METGRPKVTFWRPGSDAPGTANIAEERPDSSAGDTQPAVFNPHASLSVQQQRERLPVFKHRTHILYLLERYRTVVVIGETGCGKSTQIPQYLLEAGWAAAGRCIAVTQPRRVAAVTVATRVAEERGCDVGREIGYAVRFDDCAGTDTRVKFLTDGLLAREMMSDPLLTRYSVVMLDEAHERSAQTDVAIGLLRKIQHRRKDLRIIVASATLDARIICDFFDDDKSSGAATGDSLSPVAAISIEGRTFPVELFYVDDPMPDYVKGTIATVMGIHRTERNGGDVLAFLTGQEEVETVVRALIEEAKRLPKDAMRMRVLPMYGSLPTAEQLRVFERTPRGVRKIVVATNIAEASITIDGVVFVVDCGYVRLKAYNPRVGADCLITTEVSQASADQRAGRAGRVRSGKVYRLYTESAYTSLCSSTVPEVQRSDPASLILQLKALGVDNILRFKFLSAPPAENVVRGLELLYALGALDDACHLTNPVGRAMAEVPLPPMFARMLLSAGEHGCTEEVATVVAMSQIQNVFSTGGERSRAEKEHRRFAAAEGDHVTGVNVYNAFVKYGRSSRWCKDRFLNYKGLRRAAELREQIVRIAHANKIEMVSCGEGVDSLRRCLTAALFANAAKYHPSGEYRTIRDDHALSVHPTSVLYTEMPADCVLFGEIVQGGARECMRDVTVIRAEWLHELAPHYYRFGTERQRRAEGAADKRARFG